MRRTAILCTVCGLIAGGLGCQVVTGQHDCTYDPASYPLTPPDGKSPFVTVGGTLTSTGVAPAPLVETPKPAEKSADKLKDMGK